MQKLFWTLAVLLSLTTTPTAQWVGVTTKDVPGRADRTINLDAPTPRMADGKTPDLSGMWMIDTVPCEVTAIEASSHALFGDIAGRDVPLGECFPTRHELSRGMSASPPRAGQGSDTACTHMVQLPL